MTSISATAVGKGGYTEADVGSEGAEFNMVKETFTHLVQKVDLGRREAPSNTDSASLASHSFIAGAGGTGINEKSGIGVNKSNYSADDVDFLVGTS